MPNDEAMKAAPSLPRVELTIPSLPPLELIIEDESMAPEFMAGDEIVIDPAVKPEDERDFVLVRMSNGEHLFRRYRPRGKSAFDLIAENAAWKTVSIVTPSGTFKSNSNTPVRVTSYVRTELNRSSSSWNTSWTFWAQTTCGSIGLASTRRRKAGL